MLSKQRKLIIMQWNARGLTTIANIIELQNLINKRDVDIVCLCETMLKPQHKLYLNNFATYRSDRLEHGGGVAICIKRSLEHKLIAPANTSVIENISIQFTINNRPIVLTCAYSPKYRPSFTSDINKLTPIGKEFMLFGDLNAKNIAWNCNVNNTAGTSLNNIQACPNFFIHHSATPTHFPASGTTPSTIDLMLTNTTLHLSAIVALAHEMRSDHAPIVCSIEADINTKDTAKMYNFNQADWLRYRICVSNKIARNTVFTNPNDIETGLEQIRKAMHEAKEVAVPFVRKHHNYLHISQHTKEAIAARNKLNRQWQRCPRSDRKTEIKKSINAANRSIAAQINYERNLQWARTMQKLNTGSKKF